MLSLNRRMGAAFLILATSFGLKTALSQSRVSEDVSLATVTQNQNKLIGELAKVQPAAFKMAVTKHLIPLWQENNPIIHKAQWWVGEHSDDAQHSLASKNSDILIALNELTGWGEFFQLYDWYWINIRKDLVEIGERVRTYSQDHKNATSLDAAIEALARLHLDHFPELDRYTKLEYVMRGKSELRSWNGKRILSGLHQAFVRIQGLLHDLESAEHAIKSAPRLTSPISKELAFQRLHGLLKDCEGRFHCGREQSENAETAFGNLAYRRFVYEDTVVGSLAANAGVILGVSLELTLFKVYDSSDGQTYISPIAIEGSLDFASLGADATINRYERSIDKPIACYNGSGYNDYKQDHNGVLGLGYRTKNDETIGYGIGLYTSDFAEWADDVSTLNFYDDDRTVLCEGEAQLLIPVSFRDKDKSRLLEVLFNGYNIWFLY